MARTKFAELASRHKKMKKGGKGKQAKRERDDNRVTYDELDPAPHQSGKRKRRTRPGGVALREIKHYQRTTELLCQKLPFQRLVRSICREMCGKDSRFSSQALVALQEGAESYMVGLFEDSHHLCMHAKRCTIFSKDMSLCRRIRGDDKAD